MTQIKQNSSNEILISQTLERKHENPNHECKIYRKYRATEWNKEVRSSRSSSNNSYMPRVLCLMNIIEAGGKEDNKPLSEPWYFVYYLYSSLFTLCFKGSSSIVQTLFVPFLNCTESFKISEKCSYCRSCRVSL